MAITISVQPEQDGIASTLIPIFFKCLETTASTTNLIARCYYEPCAGGDPIKVGGDFRLAPRVDFTDLFYFDASEVFNTITKYTLDDMPNNIKVGKANLTFSELRQVWECVATYKVYVNFYIESVNADGLVEVDWDNPVKSNEFYVHQGSPEQSWLASPMVSNNGTFASSSALNMFNMYYQSDRSGKRFLTNYPIQGTRPESQVDIRTDESFLLAFFNESNLPNAGYQTRVQTLDNTGSILNTHTDVLQSSSHYTTFLCGWRDMFASGALTPNTGEGTNFENVKKYTFQIWVGNSPSASSQVYYSTKYVFNVIRKCKEKGYLRFCFLNQLGGYDMVTSKGAYITKQKAEFEKFDRSQGYDEWDNGMYFGKSNWAGTNTMIYSVTTQLMRKDKAEHFAQMFASSQVYLKFDQQSVADKVEWANIDAIVANQPSYFRPIRMQQATARIINTNDNVYKLKFDFEVSINERTPRY